MSSKTTDIAYNYLDSLKKGASFKDIYKAVSKEMGYDDQIAKKKMSQFYTDLSIDGRFIMLKDNKWNLKTHCKYTQVSAAQKEIDLDEDEEELEIDKPEDIKVTSGEEEF